MSWNFEIAQQPSSAGVIPPIKYLDCLHKVCVGDQLRILPSVFNTRNVCTSVVIMTLVEELECLQTLLL